MKINILNKTGYNQKKENFYPSPRYLWDYFYCGIISSSKNSLFIQELEIQYEIVGYKEDISFNERILQQIEFLPNLRKFSIGYKIKQNVLNNQSVEVDDIQQSIKFLHSAIIAIIKRGCKQIECFTGKIIINSNTNLLNIQFSRTEKSQSKTWTNSILKFKNRSSNFKKSQSLDMIISLFQILENNIFKTTKKLQISIEQLGKDQSKAPYSIYQLLLHILLFNNQLKIYKLNLIEDSFHLRVKVNENNYHLKYFDCYTITKFIFNCIERFRGLKLLYHYIDTHFTRNNKILPKNIKSLIYCQNEINKMIIQNKDKLELEQIQQQKKQLKQKQKQIHTEENLKIIKNKDEELSCIVEESFISLEDQSNQNDFEENTNDSQRFMIQKSLQKPPSFIFDIKTINSSQTPKSMIYKEEQNSFTEIKQDGQNTYQNKSKSLQETDIKQHKKSISSLSEIPQDNGLEYKDDKEQYLIDCQIDIDCIDSFERYEEFFLNSLSNMVSKKTDNMKIIIRDCNFFDQNQQEMHQGKQRILIQMQYQEIFCKILSRMQEWPRQQINFQIISRKVCQYSLQLQKNYFQICNIVSNELINIEMSISDDITQIDQRAQTQLMQNRMEIAKQQGNTSYQNYKNKSNKIFLQNELFGIIQRMNKYLVSIKNWAFVQEFQKMIYGLGHSIFELHMQYQSFDNEFHQESILNHIIHLNTDQVSCVYVNLYQQKSHNNINKNFFIWLDTLIKNRLPEETQQSLLKKENSKLFNSKKSAYKTILLNSNFNLSTLTVLQINVQDIQLLFNCNRELKITKWSITNSQIFEKQVISVLESKFSKNIHLITTSSNSLTQKDIFINTELFQSDNLEDFEINYSQNLAVILVKSSQGQTGNMFNQQLQSKDNYIVRSGLSLRFGRIIQKVKRIEIVLNPKSAQFQTKLANTLSKINEFNDLKIFYECNPNASWEEYTLIGCLGAVPARMLHVYIQDEEKDLKFLDQTKTIFHNLLKLENLITFQIKIQESIDLAQTYKQRHFEFLTPFLYFPKNLIHLQVISPHKKINKQFNFNKRYLLILSIKALQQRMVYRKDILSQVFEFYI